MILTSISAKTLILGKIISIMVLGIVQILTIIVPIIIGFVAISSIGTLAKDLNLPDLMPIISAIKWDFGTIAISAVILVAGFMMTTGFIVALGSAMPTAQEASNYFAAIIMPLMMPFFVFPSFLSSEPSTLTIFLSYFPLTSLLLRNMLGTLSLTEAFIGISLLVIFAIFAVWLAVRIFRFGTISYGSKVNLKSIFSKKKIA